MKIVFEKIKKTDFQCSKINMKYKVLNLWLIILVGNKVLGFVYHIFLSIGFWYFGHFSCVIFVLVFFSLAHLALQNVKKDYIIFLYFRNFIAKSEQKPKTKNVMNKTIINAFLNSDKKVIYF
jgi:hypothetical protein